MTTSYVIPTATREAMCAMCGHPIRVGDKVLVTRSEHPDVDVVHAVAHHEPDCGEARLVEFAKRTLG